MRTRVHITMRKVIERLRYESLQANERRSWRVARGRLSRELEAKRDAGTGHDARRN